MNCHFTGKGEQCDQAFLSLGDTRFTACHFENCKRNALRISGKSLVNKSVFSANSECGVQVIANGELNMAKCKVHGNNVGIYMGEESGPCRIVDCEIYDNRYQGIVTFRSFEKYIIRNRIYQNDRHGINLEGKSFTHIEENEIFENCWNGVATMDNARCKVVSNKVYRNKHGGIQVVPIGPGPQECHSVVENNEIFENCGPAIFDEMVFSDDPSLPVRQTLHEHTVLLKNLEKMRKAKCRGNNDRNNNKTSNENFKHENDTLNFCGFCGEKKPLKNCTGCYSIGYCSKRCQKNDWRTKGHEKVCASLLQESSVLVSVLPKKGLPNPRSKDLTFNQQAPGLDPKGPEYAKPPKHGQRFIVKIQAGDGVRQSNLGGSLLVIYDRSMTIHGDLDRIEHQSLYNTVQRCGENCHGIGWTKMFFWAKLTNSSSYNSLRIFTKRLPPYQNW